VNESTAFIGIYHQGKVRAKALDCKLASTCFYKPCTHHCILSWDGVFLTSLQLS